MLKDMWKTFISLFRKDPVALVSFSGESDHFDAVWDEYNMDILWNWLVHQTNPNQGGNVNLFQRVMEAKKHKDYYTLMVIASGLGVRFESKIEEV